MSARFPSFKTQFTKKNLIISLLFILVLSTTVTTLMLTVFNKYERSDFIEILSNEDASKYNFPGEGSVLNPFIIEGLKFKSSEDFDVKIHNTTFSFIIRNCYFTNTEYCLRIWKQDSGSFIFENNVFKLNTEEHRYAFASIIQESKNVTFRENRYLGYQDFFQFGLMCDLSSDVFIQDNYFEYQLVNFRYCQNISVDNNQFKVSEKTMNTLYAYNVTNVTISNTQTFHKPSKFRLSECKNLRVYNNTMQEGRVDITNNQNTDYFDHFVDNNKIAGKMYGFFVNITDQVITNQYSSLHLILSKNISISNQKHEDTFFDIKIEDCEDCSVVNSSLANSLSYGIHVIDSSNTCIISNKIENTYLHSIFIDSSPNSTIENNNITDSFQEGYYVGYQFYAIQSIMIADSPNSTITYNHISSGRCSLQIEESHNTTISSNKLTSFDLLNMMKLNQIYSLQIVNNTINDKEFGFFINQNTVNLSNNYDQFIAVNCTNVFLENGLFDSINSQTGYLYNCSDIHINSSRFISIENSRSVALFLKYCTDIVVTNTCFEKGYNGMDLQNCTSVSFSSLSFNDLESTGIENEYGMNISILNCEFRYTSQAIHLYSTQNITITNIVCTSAYLSFWNCDNVTVQYSNFYDCDVCISLGDSTRINILNNSFEYEIIGISFSNYDPDAIYINIIDNILIGGVVGIILDSITSPTIIERNAIYNNIENEMFGEFYGGIYASHCEHITVSYNFIGYNSRGVFLYSTSYSVIEFNIFERNVEYAIRMSAFSHNNLVAQNNFLENNLKGDNQAYDDGSNNRWNSMALIGNYWSNCINEDNCPISGDALDHDFHPLDEPVEIPYNASYFHIELSESSYNLEVIVVLIGAVLVRILFRRRKSH